MLECLWDAAVVGVVVGGVGGGPEPRVIVLVGVRGVDRLGLPPLPADRVRL